MNTRNSQEAYYYQPKNQMYMFAAVMFGSIMAAVLLSTVIIMSLMRGEMAAALTNYSPVLANNTSPGDMMTASACVDPTVKTAGASHDKTGSNGTFVLGAHTGGNGSHEANGWQMKPLAMHAGANFSYESHVTSTVTNTENKTFTDNRWSGNTTTKTAVLAWNNGNDYSETKKTSIVVIKDNGNSETNTTNSTETKVIVKDNGNTTTNDNSNQGNNSSTNTNTNTNIQAWDNFNDSGNTDTSSTTTTNTTNTTNDNSNQGNNSSTNTTTTNTDNSDTVTVGDVDVDATFEDD